MSKLLWLALLSFSSCTGPDLAVAKFLVPDEFHIDYGQGYGDSFGDISRVGGPFLYNTTSESESWYWQAGFSWRLTSPPMDEELRRATMDLRLITDLMQEQSKYAQENRGSDSLVTGWLGHLEGAAHRDPEPPRKEPADDPIRSFTQIMVALGVIATAISGWLGRRYMKSMGSTEPES